MAAVNESENKCLVIVNQSDVDITFYTYVGLAPLCKVSTESKIIKPEQRYLYHEKKTFKFEISYSAADKKRQKLLGTEKYSEDQEITITKSLQCQIKMVAEIENRRRILLREVYRKEDVAATDLYDILGLNMKRIRKMEIAEGKKVMEKAFKKQMLIWHPDKNFGSGEMAVQIILAWEILKDDGKRARYHREFDYSKGWFSIGRWKAIIFPEGDSKQQKKAFKRRILLSIASIIMVTGGIALSLGTAGAAAPLVVILGAIFGAGLTGAGFQSLGHTLSERSVVDGCDIKSWALKAGIGFVGGAITGGAGVGITAGMVGVGSAALRSSALTAAQYVTMGSAVGAVGGVASSLASDAAKVLVDKEKVTAKHVFFRALAGGAIGACAGAAAGLVTTGIVDRQAAAATPALEGDVVEQVSALTGGRRIAHAVGHAVAKQVTLTGAKTMLGIAPKVVDERLDDSVENQKIAKHVQNEFENISASALQSAALYAAGGFIGHGLEETALHGQTSRESNAESCINTDENIQELGNEQDSAGSGKNDEQENEEPERNTMSKPAQEPDNMMMSKLSFCQGEKKNIITPEEKGTQSPDNQICEEQLTTEQNSHVVLNESTENQSPNSEACHLDNPQPSNEVSAKQEADDPPKVMIKCRSKGAWVSKMIVTWHLVQNSERSGDEVSGDGGRIYIPAHAKDVEVSFQVRRPFWGDVMKYDRFKKKWCKPHGVYTRHIFHYKTPVDRTFTLSGPLRWEAVMRVSDEHHEETEEMS